MSKLLFLFDNSQRFAVRVEKCGFLKTCKKYAVSPQRIIYLNTLTSEPKENEILLIEKNGCVLHEVKPSENILQIAKTYEVSAEEILNFNHAQFIYPYQLIEIPNRKI